MASDRRLTALAYACLLMVGIHVGWMGPFLPEISRLLTVSIDRAGLIISATSAGYFLALIAAGAVSHRHSAQTILVVAMVLFAAGLAGLAAAPGLSALLCASVVIGLANGAIDVAANALIVDLNRERLASALNYLHVLFGIGALMGPLVVAGALARQVSYRWVFAAGAVFCAATALALIATPAIEVKVPEVSDEGVMHLLARPITWIIAGVLFLYVGGETGVGAWLFLYLRTAAAAGATIASSGVSLYWLGLIAGRVTGGRIAHRIGARELTVLGSAISALALLGLIAIPRWPLVAALMVFLIGFGYGPIFPNMVAVGAQRFPSQVGRMTSIIVGGGAFGGMFVPWLMGRAMAVATPRTSMECALAVTVLMVLLSCAVRDRRAPPLSF
ncbi:MAG TPA: MFS transporter [Candidatus Binataceae bacterium]|nr:MFS transporter [Candidatus Binataceae bacterium]